MATNQYQIKVYKIWYEDCPEEFYIGSTKKKYSSERMCWHRKDCRRGNSSKLYNLMREKGMNSFKHVQVAWSNVSNIEEQRMVEQRYLDQLKPTLNMVRAIRKETTTKEYNKQYSQTHKEQKKLYNQNNKEHNSKRNKEYNERNKNMKTCICGGDYNFGFSSHRNTHYKSNKHQEHVKLIWEKLNSK